MFDAKNLTLIGLYLVDRGDYWAGGLILVLAFLENLRT